MISTPQNDPRFHQVEATVSLTLRLASGVIANCFSSYSAHEYRVFQVVGASAVAEIYNAFAYEGQKLRLSRRDGKAEQHTELSIGLKNQFSLEIDHMAHCIRTNSRPRTPGEEGLQDQIIMAAIYEAHLTLQPVKLAAQPGTDVYRGAAPEPGA